MKTVIFSLLLGLGTAQIFQSAVGAEAENSPLNRTQVVDLTKGWNAVFLEVEPADSEPAKVFAGLPVDIAASYFPGDGSAEEFITNPGINLAKSKGWGVWYSSERPEAFLKSLGSIYGQQAYLVHAKSAFRWSIKGGVVPSVIRWRPDSYNLVGFGVRALGAPTFAEFFAGSPAHHDQPIYRLVNGNWKKVTLASAESMRSGEAFWIYCSKSSDYQGPLGVELPLQQGLVLSKTASKFVLRNRSGNPISATLERVATGANELPISMVIAALGDPANPLKSIAVEKPTAPWTQDLPPLEVGAAFSVPFEARTLEMTAPYQGALIKVTTDLGTESWVPMYGVRQDLNP